MDAVGPLSRTVEDAAITLGAIAGHDPKDPYTWNTPVPDYRGALDGNVKDIRVGLITEQIDNDIVEPEVREAVIKATSVLGELGAKVDEVSLPLSKYETLITTISLAVEPALNHRDWLRSRLKDYSRLNQIMLLTGSVMPAQAYYKAQKLRTLLRRQVLETLERYDVLALPTIAKPADPIEEDPAATGKQTPGNLPILLTRSFNLASSPAITVPCGLSSDGLPIALQLGGRPGGDGTVLKVAHAYEQHTPWHTMRPPAA